MKAWKLAAFAAPSLPLAAFGLPLVVYLPEYYSNTLGLPVAAVGLAFLTVRLADIGFDPVFGLVLDRTRTRFGRYRPWLAVAALLMMAASAWLFMARPGVSVSYLWFGLLLAYAAFSVGVLTQTAWGATLSQDYQERSKVYAFWQGGNVLGILLAMLAPLILGLLGAKGAQAGMQGLGWLIIAMAPLMMAVAIFGLKEPPAPPGAAVAHARLSDFAPLLKRASVVRVLSADVLMGLATGLQGSLFFFYFQRAKDISRAQAEVLIVAYFLAAVLGAVLWTPLARRFGKAGGVIAAGVAVCFAQGVLALAPSGNFAALVFAAALSGLPYSAAPFLLRSAMADIADEWRLESGEDRVGLLYALAAGGAKVGAALTGGAFIILGALGFNAANQAASSATGERALALIYLIAPAVLALLASAAMLGYPLTHARHTEIRRALDAKA